LGAVCNLRKSYRDRGIADWIHLARIGKRGDAMEAIRPSNDGRDSADQRRKHNGVLDWWRSICTASEPGNGNSGRDLHDYRDGNLWWRRTFRIGNNYS
jgi:hypothetical protein